MEHGPTGCRSGKNYNKRKFTSQVTQLLPFLPTFLGGSIASIAHPVNPPSSVNCQRHILTVPSCQVCVFSCLSIICQSHVLSSFFFPVLSYCVNCLQTSTFKYLWLTATEAIMTFNSAQLVPLLTIRLIATCPKKFR